MYPVFTVTDADLARTAGLDALMLLRVLVLGMQLFAPVAFLGEQASAVDLPQDAARTSSAPRRCSSVRNRLP